MYVNGIVHGKETRAVGLEAVCQRGLNLSEAYRIRSRREELVLRTVQKFVCQSVAVVGQRVFVAHSDACPSCISEVARILGKGGDVVLLYVGIGI